MQDPVVGFLPGDSSPGQVRLLAMLGSRVSAEIAGLVIPPVLIWLHDREHDAARMWWWAAVYWALCLGSLALRQRFRRDLQALPPAELITRWLPRFHGIALAFGATWGALAWLTAGHSSYDFAILVYLVVSAVVASTAVLAAPVLSVFGVFFAAAWGGGTTAVYAMFPDHWPWVLPLQLVYGLIIMRHARATHRFVVEQVRLEEQSAQLAQRYLVARDQAERALRAKSEFLLRASHDLRQPVHALAMIADVLAHRNVDPRAQALLADLKSCVHTLQQMFESLMDLSQLQSGALLSRPQPCRLRTLVAEVDAQFRGEAQARRLRWRVRLGRGDALVRADPVLLRRAVFNLVQNALRYTREGGVLIAVRRRGGAWRIEVRDTGVGVTEQDKEAIYEPFFRHAQARRSDSSGHGLGLAVFAECVQLMGARSGLWSVPGQGSCFWLALDVAQDAAEDGATASSAIPGGPAQAVVDQPSAPS